MLLEDCWLGPRQYPLPKQRRRPARRIYHVRSQTACLEVVPPKLLHISVMAFPESVDLRIASPRLSTDEVEKPNFRQMAADPFATHSILMTLGKIPLRTERMDTLVLRPEKENVLITFV